MANHTQTLEDNEYLDLTDEPMFDLGIDNIGEEILQGVDDSLFG